jgi:hypothetical protein
MLRANAPNYFVSRINLIYYFVFTLNYFVINIIFGDWKSFFFSLMKRSKNQGLIDFFTAESIAKAKQTETRFAQTPVCS